jgi:hypothetical protein
MFDLKAKLLAKGLVTKEQVEKIAREQEIPRPSPVFVPEREGDFLTRERLKAVKNLKAQQKSEQYLIIRKWVDINRLDKSPSSLADCEKFFFNGHDNQVTWLTLPKIIIDDIRHGKAGVITYMSNHGLAHAVVPRDIAEDVGEVFQEWVRVLNSES